MDDKITLYHKENDMINRIYHNIQDGLETLTSHAFAVQAANIEDINMNDTAIFFIIYNSYNDLFLAVLKLAELHIEDALEMNLKERISMIIILIISILT